MRSSVNLYTTLVFDCDGVVLNSNKVKTEAFYQATLPFGQAAASAMVDYHVANGGISRYKKFAHFLEQIVPIHAEHQGPDIDGLLQAYASHVREGLLSCELSPALEMLRRQIPDTRWLIVSGGDQTELRDVFTQRGIADWFDASIFGSPDTKDEILARELASGNIRQPALFLGDSKYDYKAATAAGLDFVFLSDWSEVVDWHAWVAEQGIDSVNSIQSLAEI
ncbi:HAD family hydrolase [Marinobacterium mangrovicola]|uniref:phosphoglycolate phosphatase n=1 Tax=Marinobacterium mangrovicola TaxID=1476959 RepID=A0A4R1GG56_9GAMM|nr:HAD family hydrolase [Marinobacterium mangrovicola]TCK07254.1 phosphoglycolate phosphatase-like HAD superfamily hydrolase [Marinobacterium mangrovicola]